MPARRVFLSTAFAILGLSLSVQAIAESEKPLSVVATFSILGDMVKRIGGEHIEVTTLVGPNGDPHVYQPTPTDGRVVSQADVLFFNGLHFEGWLDRLVEATDFDGMHVVATMGVDPIKFDSEEDHEEHHDEHEEHHDDDHEEHEEHADTDHDHHHHGEIDPHAWQSLREAVIYVDNITHALSRADPANAAAFYQNRAAYVAEIKALDAEIRSILATLPANRRTIVTAHDAFGYFARDYGLTFLAPQGISTESETSAREVAHLIEQIRDQNISAVFLENMVDGRLLKQITNETDATIGGTLYPGALSEPDGPAPTYLDMMRHNAMTIAQSLSP